MLTLRRAFIPVALTIGAFGCPAEEPNPATPAPNVLAEVKPKAMLRQLSGSVTIKRAQGDDWSTAQNSIELFENDKVRTAAGATAVIHFTSGSVVNVAPESFVSIAESQPRPGQRRSDLTVLQGKIDAELADPSAQALTVSTPTAVVRAGREIVFQ